jgi:hypothetical protein
MANKRQQKKQVNNAKKSPATPAEGSTVYTTNALKWVAPKIDTALIEKYVDNALLAEPVNNLKNLIFRGEAQVTVYDPDSNTDDDLSNQAKAIYQRCDLYAAHQMAFTDREYGGCSVFSPALDIVDGMIAPVEFRNLPWNSFRDLPYGFIDTYNDVMPGIVWDKTANKVRVFQKESDTAVATEIQNFVIIRDPTYPKPAGKPDCLPVVPLITNYNYGQKAWQQKMNRVAAPSIFPYVEKLTAANKPYMEAIAQKWGKDTCFLMEGTMDFKDPKIRESATAEGFLAWHKKWIDSYFNPSTFLQKEGNTIGASDSGAMELIYNYIDATLTWIENQITAATLQKWLDDNGFDGYRAEIRHPRPSVKKDAQILAEVAELARNGAITANEMRQALPNTDLGELTPEVEAQLQAQVRARQPSPFGGIPIGNVQNPVERTVVLSTEEDLIAATRQCEEDVKRIVREKMEK